MNILYTTDKNYINIMLTSILSLIENSGLNTIKLHIVEEGFTNEDFDLIKRLTDLYKNVEVEFYDFTKCPIESLNIPKWRGTQIANARLLYPEILNVDKGIENLLYLDSDTLIVGNLTEINNYKDNILSACLEDSTLKTYYKNLGLNQYFNSGVLSFNCNKWTKFDIKNNIKSLINNNIKLNYPDQDLLNIIFKEEIAIMPTRYNISAYPFLLKNIESKIYYSKRQLSYNEVMYERDYAKILHCYGLFNIKPWYNSKINPFSEIYGNYLTKACPNFKREELKNAKKFFDEHPHIFKSILITKTFLPSFTEDYSRQLSLKLQKK